MTPEPEPERDDLGYIDRKGITEKTCYDKRAAHGRANELNGMRGRRNVADHTRAYHCPHCNCWHITSKPLRRDSEVTEEESRDASPTSASLPDTTWD